MTEQEALIKIRMAKASLTLRLDDLEFTPSIEEALSRLVLLEELKFRGNNITRLPNNLPSQIKKIDCSFTSVEDLSPLANLLNLNVLDCTQTNVRDLRPIANLTGLTTLWCSHTKVRDLKPLSKLRKLESFYCSNSQVSDLHPLSDLFELKTLRCSETSVEDIKPISKLQKIKDLNFSRTLVKDLSPLRNLIHLQRLNLSESKIEELFQIGNLPELEILDISFTYVKDIKPLKPMLQRGLQVNWEFGAGLGIFVQGCIITNLPPEISKQGNRAILSFFDAQEGQGTLPVLEAKLILVGDGDVGKTSLIRRMFFPSLPLPKASDSTKGIDIHSIFFPIVNSFQKWKPAVKSRKLNFFKKMLRGNFEGEIELSKKIITYGVSENSKMRLNVWDFGGQQIYRSTHQFFLTKRSIYILVDQTRTDDQNRKDLSFQYWLEMIETRAGSSPIFFFQNQKGGRSKAIEKKSIRTHYPNVEDFFEGDLSQKSAADSIKRAIQNRVLKLDHVGTQWPKKWFKVREELEKIAKTNPYILKSRYLGLFEYHVFPDSEEDAMTLSGYLHDLGIILHFQLDPILKDIVILQNQWATEAVFKVLDNEKVKAQFGYFDEEDCGEIWKDATYNNRHIELRQLMLNFELCYELKDQDPPKWLVPQLLSPEEKSDITNRDDATIHLKYSYDIFPSGMVNRLMVRNSSLVKYPNKSWRSGAVFESELGEMLVETPFQKKEIHFWGKGSRVMELKAILTHDLERLNHSFEGLRGKVRKYIPCTCENCRRNIESYDWEFSHLMDMKNRVGSDEKLQCNKYSPFCYISIGQLLEGETFKSWPDGTRILRKEEPTLQDLEKQGEIIIKNTKQILKNQEIEIDRLLRILQISTSCQNEIREIGQKLEDQNSEFHENLENVLKEWFFDLEIVFNRHANVFDSFFEKFDPIIKENVMTLRKGELDGKPLAIKWKSGINLILGSIEIEGNPNLIWKEKMEPFLLNLETLDAIAYQRLVNGAKKVWESSRRLIGK